MHNIEAGNNVHWYCAAAAPQGTIVLGLFAPFFPLKKIKQKRRHIFRLERHHSLSFWRKKVIPNFFGGARLAEAIGDVVRAFRKNICSTLGSLIMAHFFA